MVKVISPASEIHACPDPLRDVLAISWLSRVAEGLKLKGLGVQGVQGSAFRGVRVVGCRSLRASGFQGFRGLRVRGVRG